MLGFYLKRKFEILVIGVADVFFVFCFWLFGFWFFQVGIFTNTIRSSDSLPVPKSKFDFWLTWFCKLSFTHKHTTLEAMPERQLATLESKKGLRPSV